MARERSRQRFASCMIISCTVVAMVAAWHGAGMVAGQPCLSCESALQEPTATPTPERWFSHFPIAARGYVYPPTPGAQGEQTWVGCRQVLPNPSFEKGLEGWTVRGGSPRVVRADPPAVSAHDGEHVLELRTRTEERSAMIGLAREFASIPPERFESLRYGAWVRRRGGTEPGGTSVYFSMGADWRCGLHVRSDRAGLAWQRFDCAETDPRAYYTRSSWSIFVGAHSHSEEQRPEMTWLVDSLSVEICLKDPSS